MEFLKELFGEKPLTFDEFTDKVNQKGLKLFDLSAGGYMSMEKHRGIVEGLKEQLNTANEKLTDYDPEWKKKSEAAEKAYQAQLTQLYGVDGLLNRRASNHVLRMASELDTEFFKVAADNATAVETEAGLSVEEELEAVIQECENTQNDFVDGVPREMMHLVLNTAYYGKVRNALDKTSRANVDSTAEEFYAWHGVECKSCTHLPKDVKYILMVTGAVAQPIMANQYTAEKIPLSEAFGVSLFYHYGTACVMPDLIFKGVIATQSEGPKTTDAENKGGTD